MNIEILAPAGSFDSVRAAVCCGADAVYVGGKDFSARANAVNFTDEELSEAVRYCHLRGVKIYRAMNTVVFDDEMESFVNEVRKSAEAGIDGLIIQDIGALEAAKAAVPDLPLHASTQMTLHTREGAFFARDMGMCRIVPARELSLSELKTICDTGMETEAFVHGALCMCVSGQCYMSAVIGSRSANRGQCAQSCRLPFSAIGKTKAERHDLSLKDMSYIRHMDDMIEAGIFSYKIEGRMKRAEYTAAAVSALRSAADGEDSSILDEKCERLKAVFSRSGFTDGYLTGKTGADMFGFRTKDDVTAAADVLPELAELYRKDRKCGKINFRCTLKKGEPSVLSFEYDGITGHVEGMNAEEARNRPTSEDDVKKQLAKLGDTIYELGEVTCDIEEGVILPMSALNALRRECTALADRLVTEKNTPVYHISDSVFSAEKKRPSEGVFTGMRFETDRADTAAKLAENGYTAVLTLDECEKLDKGNENILVLPPRFITDEDDISDRLKALYDKGFTELYCPNYAYLRTGKNIGMGLHGGWQLNVTNSNSAKVLADYGVSDIMLSPEMKASEISRICSPVETGVYAYGNMPLMLTRNCPVKNCTGCHKCAKKGVLTDRTGREFPVRCSREYGYTEILNCDRLDISDCAEDMGGVSFVYIDVRGASIEGALRMAKRFENHEKPEGKYTRGLYYRGII